MLDNFDKSFLNLFFFQLPIIFCMHISLLMKIYASNLIQSFYLAYLETQASTVELSFVFRYSTIATKSSANSIVFSFSSFTEKSNCCAPSLL